MPSIFPRHYVSKEVSFWISSNGMLYNNISQLPIICILVVKYKYSNMHNTFPESRQISMYTSWTTRYIGNDNWNTYLCLFGRFCLDLFLLESLPMCSPSLSDSEDMFLSCLWSEILIKSSYTTYHIEPCLCVLPVHPFLSNDGMDKSIIFIFISIILLDHISRFLRNLYLIYS